MKKFLMGIKAYLQQRKTLHQKHQEEKREEYLRSVFSLKERDGKLWVVTADRAVYEFDEDDTVSEVIQYLSHIRNTNKRYNENVKLPLL